MNMARDNARKFMEQMKDDEVLQKKIKAATEAYAGDKTYEKASGGYMSVYGLCHWIAGI